MHTFTRSHVFWLVAVVVVLLAAGSGGAQQPQPAGDRAPHPLVAVRVDPRFPEFPRFHFRMRLRCSKR